MKQVHQSRSSTYISPRVARQRTFLIVREGILLIIISTICIVDGFNIGNGFNIALHIIFTVIAGIIGIGFGVFCIHVGRLFQFPGDVMLKGGAGYDIYRTFFGHEEFVDDVMWSSDGKLLASFSYDDSIRIWYAESSTDTSSIRVAGHENIIKWIAWSPDGNRLASASKDKTVRLWDVHSGNELALLRDHTDVVNCVTWSPDGQILASCSRDGTVRLWDGASEGSSRVFFREQQSVHNVAWSPDGKMLAIRLSKEIYIWDILSKEEYSILSDDNNRIYCMAWSPDGEMLACGRKDPAVSLWNVKTRKLLDVSQGHSNIVTCLVWSPNGRILASGSKDRTVCMWEVPTGKRIGTLEGHTSQIRQITFYSDGRLFASLAAPPSLEEKMMIEGNIIYYDTFLPATTYLWRTDTWTKIAELSNTGRGDRGANYITFHPYEPWLVTPGDPDKNFLIWKLDLQVLLDNEKQIDTLHYKNAKVVLVGDSGVGKSGLSLALTGEGYKPTESTHSRQIWTLSSQEVELGPHRRETREILLWDLAGQPGYRVIHQLHLNEVVVALVVFDSKSETDPFSGVPYWDRALQHSRLLQGDAALPLKKLLVAGRCDRGGHGVSHERIQTLVEKMDFSIYFETSAKLGWKIPELREAIENAIDWSSLPTINSPQLFQEIKSFLVEEKQRLLNTVDDLYALYLSLNTKYTKSAKNENMRAQFDTCIGRLEATGAIQRLSFGNLILLQPELLDVYASALLDEVRHEPDGLGYIKEERISLCAFIIPQRVNSLYHERLLLIALIEDLLRYELVIREGEYLVFPSESTRINPDIPEIEGKTVVFSFEGPVKNIYTTLAVRLINSGLFHKKDLWQDAITYTTSTGGVYGIFLQRLDEGQAEITLFFDKNTSDEMCIYFEDYVLAHFERRALTHSVKRRRIYTCPGCGWIVPDQLVQQAKEQHEIVINCYRTSCNTYITLLDRKDYLTEVVGRMDRSADLQRNRAVAQSVVQGKKETRDFDVFLCYNSKDKVEVAKIGQELRDREILPWFDEWELQPGLPWQQLLEQQIECIKSVAVFIGKDGIGPWQRNEMDAFLRDFVNRGCPVIPVLLASADEAPQLPVFLRGMTWVDLRQHASDPLQRLIWGITGQRGTTF